MGFQNHLQSESIPGTLPPTQNSPQHCPHNLYAEQLSGTAFTVPRTHNLRTWLYRRHPSVSHQPYRLVGWFGGTTADDYAGEEGHTPEQMRWSPFHIVEGDFVNGVKTVGLAGSPTVKHGLAIHVYSMTMGMSDRQKAIQCSDGDWLIVPQQGTIQVMTEFGKLVVEPGEIIVIPCGIKMAIDPLDTNTHCRGYILETQSHNHFELPDLGPIGANGLANPHHFCHPTASELGDGGEWVVVNKYAGKQFECKMSHTPFDVVAWRGNYLPYKYDLRLFNAIGTVTFDHPVRSLFYTHTYTRVGPEYIHSAHCKDTVNRHRPRRLCHLSAAVGRCRPHLSPALLPPQHHVRVYGADIW